MPIWSSDFFNYTLHEPVGVVGLIVPWNLPLIAVAAKIGPGTPTNLDDLPRSQTLQQTLLLLLLLLVQRLRRATRWCSSRRSRRR